MQPQEESLSHIIQYNLSILFILLSIVIPYFITFKLLKNRNILANQDIIERWGILCKDFKSESLLDILFYAIFLFRRLIIGLSLILFKDYPYIQIIACSISCWTVRCI